MAMFYMFDADNEKVLLLEDMIEAHTDLRPDDSDAEMIVRSVQFFFEMSAGWWTTATNIMKHTLSCSHLASSKLTNC